MSLIEKITSLFKAHAAEAEKVEVKHEDLKLADGTTVIRVSALEPKGSIMIVKEDGTEYPAAVGEYTLEDGRVLIVEEEGIIAVVKEAVMEEDKKVENEKVEDKKEEISLSEIQNSIMFLAERIKAIESEYSKVKVENETIKKENEALKIVPAPAVKEVKFKKLADKESKSNKKESKYASFVKDLKK